MGWLLTARPEQFLVRIPFIILHQAGGGKNWANIAPKSCWNWTLSLVRFVFLFFSPGWCSLFRSVQFVLGGFWCFHQTSGRQGCPDVFAGFLPGIRLILAGAGGFPAFQSSPGCAQLDGRVIPRGGSSSAQVFQSFHVWVCSQPSMGSLGISRTQSQPCAVTGCSSDVIWAALLRPCWI